MTPRNQLTRFATRDAPIRVSSVPRLMTCAARNVLMYLQLSTDTSGEAAHNGSSFHCLLEGWYGSGFDTQHAIALEASRRHEWPNCKFEKAVLPAFLGYAADPRNRVELIASEIAINFEIDPSPDDPTGELIYLTGHIDQIRGPVPQVWDTKLSRLGGGDLINSYAYQIAFYSIGATKFLGREVSPGGIIRCSTYATEKASKSESPDGVFFPVHLGPDVMQHMVDSFAKRVAAIRRGEVFAVPGDWCTYCPLGHVSRCVPLIQEVTHG